MAISSDISKAIIRNKSRKRRSDGIAEGAGWKARRVRKGQARRLPFIKLYRQADPKSSPSPGSLEPGTSPGCASICTLLLPDAHLLAQPIISRASAAHDKPGRDHEPMKFWNLCIRSGLPQASTWELPKCALFNNPVWLAEAINNI